MSKSRHAANQKRAVWNGTIPKTDSGLVKADLVESKSGQIVSRKKQEQGKKQMAMLRARGLAAPQDDEYLASLRRRRASL